jgi:hypothetical protein
MVENLALPMPKLSLIGLRDEVKQAMEAGRGMGVIRSAT